MMSLQYYIVFFHVAEKYCHLLDAEGGSTLLDELIEDYTKDLELESADGMLYSGPSLVI